MSRSYEAVQTLANAYVEEMLSRVPNLDPLEAHRSDIELRIEDLEAKSAEARRRWKANQLADDGFFGLVNELNDEIKELRKQRTALRFNRTTMLDMRMLHVASAPAARRHVRRTEAALAVRPDRSNDLNSWR